MLIIFILAYFQKFGFGPSKKELYDTQESHGFTKNDLSKSNGFFLYIFNGTAINNMYSSIILSKNGNWDTEFSKISGKYLYR